MITGCDNQLIFASGRVYFGFTSQFCMLPSSFHWSSFDPFCVHTPALSDISHHCPLPLPQTQIGFSLLFSPAHKY